MSTYPLEIVTPDRKFFEGDVELTIVRTAEGDVGVMYNHEALVAPIKIGAIKVKRDGQVRVAACGGGFITVEEEGTTTIITDSAEWEDEIDVDRAKAALERAKARLKENKEIDVVRARASMDRAMNRLRIKDIR